MRLRNLLVIPIALWSLLAGGAPAVAAADRQVLAFYYAWWATPAVRGHWAHWGCARTVGGAASDCVDTARHAIDSSTFYPAGGPYDSADPAVIERQASEAQTAGLTGWIYEWWGPPGSPDDLVLPAVLAAANRHHLKLAVMVAPFKQENGSLSDEPPQNLPLAERSLTHIVQRYGNDPAYLRVDNRPVIFLYTGSFHQLTKQRPWWSYWQRAEADVAAQTGQHPFIVADVLNDGGHTANTNALSPASHVADAVFAYMITAKAAPYAGSPETLGAWARSYYADIVAADRRAGGLALATVVPGYDKHKQRPNDVVIPRFDGRTLATLWQSAMDANPDWILVVSWNEWHEGTQIEPSVEFDSQDVRTNARFAGQFLGRH